MDEVNNEYSGAVKEGWNQNGSYNRLQFLSNDSVDLETFCEIVEQGLLDITETDNTRLDIRCFLSDDFDISYILNKYKDSDIAIKTIDQRKFIIFGVNIGERKLSEDDTIELKTFISDKVENILNQIEEGGGFENHAISCLNGSLNRGFSFERENFSVEEVFKLWGHNFGWTKEEISSFINSNVGNDKIFGLRNSEGLLISLIMIGDDLETTEWSVLEEYQKTGVIESLLIAANGILIENGKAEGTYAHMRWNRSIGPGLKSGLRVNKEVDNILKNLVEIEGNMEHFLEGTLDSSLFTEKLFKNIRNFTN